MSSIKNEKLHWNGQVYYWVHDPTVEPPEDSWSWQADEDVPFDVSIARELTSVYFELHRPDIRYFAEPDRTRYARILRPMADLMPTVQAIEIGNCRDCRIETRDLYSDGRCANCH